MTTIDNSKENGKVDIEDINADETYVVDIDADELCNINNVTHVTKDNIYQYPLALGFDVETGGHVFQLFVTNSKPMVEDGFIGETTGDWLDGGLYFGFNMSRIFAIGGNAH